MKLALVAFSDTQEYRLQIKAEMSKRGHQCDILYFPLLPITKDIIERIFEELSQYDVVHFVLGFNVELAKILQGRLVKTGIACPNQRADITNLNDKVIQMVSMSRAGVPVPLSARLMNPNQDEIAALLGFPFVLKEPVGSKGKQVVLCTRENFDESIRTNREYLGQEFVNYTSDYRVHVVGSKTFCIYERIAPDGDFRANVSLGGAMKKVTDPELLARLSDLALRAAGALFVDYGGIDIISDRDGKLLVLEFNSNPGFKNVTELTGVPFYEPIADYYEALISQ